MTDKTPKTPKDAFPVVHTPRKDLTAAERALFRDAGIEHYCDNPRDPRLDDPGLSQKRFRELRFDS